MARKPDVRYIQFYTDGTAARQPEPKAPPRKKPEKKQPRPRYQLVIPVQPVALGGILVSAVLLVMMAVGSVQLYRAQQARQAMANHVASLSWDNTRKAQEYEEGLDLEAIEQAALALGMIPEDQAEHMAVSLPPLQEQPEEPGFWQRIGAFLKGIFA